MKRALLLVAAAGLVAAGVWFAVRGGGAAADASLSPKVAEAVAKMRAAHPELFQRKVILLGFDSCDPDLVDQYIREGKLRNFARLRREGAYGALRSIQPTLSPVVWTTIATGMPPQRHGILDFVVKTPTGPVPVSSKLRQADTIWDLLSRSGEKVGVVGWLVTHPAEPVNGFIVTDRVGHLAFEYLYGAPKDTGGKTWPPELLSEISDEIVSEKDMTLSRVRPFLDITAKEYDDSYSPSFDARNRVNNLRLTLATAETMRNAGERLYAERKPRFFACYFEAMDAISHLFMPYSPPKSPHVPTDLYMKYRSAVEAAYVWHDRVLGTFMDMADADTTIFVVSDHGFKSGDFRMADSSDFHAKTGAQWHRPYGVFYAWGNGVKSGAAVGGASVYDIAPTILASMGYPVSDEMRSSRGNEPVRVLSEAFENGLPYETVPTWRGETRRDEIASQRVAEGGQRPQSPEEEDQLRKLEALGYTGGDRAGVDTTAMNKVAALLSQGQVEAAYEEATKLVAVDRSPLALDSLAEVCLRKGLLEEAEKLIEESLAKNPAGQPAMMLRARTLLFRRKFEEAETAVRGALNVKNDMPNVWLTLALVLSARLDEAEKKRDAQLDPVQKERDSQAVEQIRQSLIEARESALRLEPRQPQVLVDLARDRLAGKSTSESVERARDEFTKALEMQPRNTIALNNRAIANLRLAVGAKMEGRAADEHLKAALTDADAAIALSLELYAKGYDKAWANKAYVLWHMNDLDGAAKAAAEARTLNPAYVFNQMFLSAMSASGHTVPPPAGK